ncbi:hypothetical protein HF259_06205 [Rhizobium leguminosarum]|uniref:hypothetical protein n=1 Tax=Rhizobium leguminosarum TaxID=384 RepID=UPI001C9048DD|nr:hypothetical protein [Rhizobium leguminosarum]MBY2921031.1 hypothetical protein [Rhizobium leguminosarum]
MTTIATKFTLDTNCLIAVEDNRPEKDAVLSLVAAAKDGRADVAIVASSASERQIGGGYLANIGDFVTRLGELGFGHLELLKPIGAFDVSFYDHAIYPSPEQIELQKEIFSALFPTIEPSWSKHAAGRGVEPTEFDSPEGWKWRNKLLDVQAMWAHLNYDRDVFVTSDKNFARRLLSKERFGDVIITTPGEALCLL